MRIFYVLGERKLMKELNLLNFKNRKTIKLENCKRTKSTTKP